MSPTMKAKADAAGTFSVLREVRNIHGRERKVRVLVFTTTDGHRGESRRFDHEEAYDHALEQRVRAQEAAKHRLPVPGELVAKPAPAVPLFWRMTDALLVREMLARGYDVSIPS